MSFSVTTQKPHSGLFCQRSRSQKREDRRLVEANRRLAMPDGQLDKSAVSMWPTTVEHPLGGPGAAGRRSHANVLVCPLRSFWRLKSPTNLPSSCMRTWVLSETNGCSDTTWTEWTHCGSNSGSAEKKEEGTGRTGQRDGAAHFAHAQPNKLDYLLVFTLIHTRTRSTHRSMHIGMHKHADTPSFVSSVPEQLLFGQRWTDVIEAPRHLICRGIRGRLWNNLDWGPFCLFFFLTLGCHNDKETRREAAQGEERTGEDTTPPDPTGQNPEFNSTTTRKAGL